MEYFVYNFQLFLLVFVRIMGLIYSAPFFSSTTINNGAKLGFIFFVTIVIFPLTYQYLPDIPGSMIEYSFIAILEGLIGVVLGFCLTISFAAYQLAGQFFTIQMGFGASEVFDPMSQISLPLMGQYLYLLAILVFLSLQGPVIIIRELYHSFELVSASSFIKASVVLPEYGMVALFVKMFFTALRMAFPIVGTLLLVSVTMGLLAKAAPQMNLLMIGFPISITVGFIILIVVLPGLIVFFSDYIDRIFSDLWFLMLELKR
jgi:flagellar biosynthesis protein FliR